MKKVLLVFWTVVAVLGTTQPTVAAKVTPETSSNQGFWFRHETTWIYPGQGPETTAVVAPSCYIPPDSIVLLCGDSEGIFFKDDGELWWVRMDLMTDDPVETERWDKLVIKARFGGYSSIWEFLEEVICYEYCSSAPVVMHGIHWEIMQAFAPGHLQFPTTARGVGYCLEHYTELKRAGRVPINDPNLEAFLIAMGRKPFRLPFPSRSQVCREQ